MSIGLHRRHETCAFAFAVVPGGEAAWGGGVVGAGDFAAEEDGAEVAGAGQYGDAAFYAVDFGVLESGEWDQSLRGEWGGAVFQDDYAGAGDGISDAVGAGADDCGGAECELVQAGDQ